MTTSPNMGLAYLVAGQAQKEITHNEALNDLDALAQLSVSAMGSTTPPVSPVDGDVFLLGSSPTGAWSGQGGKVALYFAGWIYKSPKAGWRAFVRDEGKLYVFDGTVWRLLAATSLEGSVSWTPGTLANGGGVSSSALSVPGAAFGDFVQVAAPYDLQGVLATAYVSAANSVVIRLHNLTGAGVSLGAGTWRVRAAKA